MNKIAFLTKEEKKRKSRLKPVGEGETLFKKRHTRNLYDRPES
jgi:hypothetical protein